MKISRESVEDFALSWKLPVVICTIIIIPFIPLFLSIPEISEQISAELVFVNNADCEQLVNFILEDITDSENNHYQGPIQTAKEIYQWKCR